MKPPQKPPAFPTIPGTLARLGKKSRSDAPTRPEPAPSGEYSGDEVPTEKRTTQMIAARLVRNWAACDPADQRLIEALAVRLRPGIGG